MIKYIIYYSPVKFYRVRSGGRSHQKFLIKIEAQLTEVREYAQKEDLAIVKEFIEKQSAKKPGRPVFNKMLASIEAGEAQGILA